MARDAPTCLGSQGELFLYGKMLSNSNGNGMGIGKDNEELPQRRRKRRSDTGKEKFRSRRGVVSQEMTWEQEGCLGQSVAKVRAVL